MCKCTSSVDLSEKLKVAFKNSVVHFISLDFFPWEYRKCNSRSDEGSSSSSVLFAQDQYQERGRKSCN